MQTTSREMSESLKKAGWVKETCWIYVFDYHEVGVEKFWKLYPRDYVAVELTDWLPATTADEIAEEVSFEDLRHYWWENSPWDDQQTHLALAKWLYITMRSADALAEVWIALHGKEIE